MNTPICDFVSKYKKSNALRLHMPGHKGVENGLGEGLDITEISGADVLYKAKGIIAESMKNATDLFGSAKTLYSTEGSSLCIRAMLYLVKMLALSKGQKPVIIAARNVHKTFVTAAALLDIEVIWHYGKDSSLLSLSVDYDCLKKQIKEHKPTAVYVTSPDYIGNITDVLKVKECLKNTDTVLAVDNAHGAYLKFLEPSLHPIDLGADIVCDSAHKTLNVLTGGAYLHISKNAPDIFAKQSEKALSIFASTSPSYLILQSLDKMNVALKDCFKADLKRTVDYINNAKNELISYGYSIIGDEPLKITIAPKGFGYTGEQLGKILEDNNIFCEFYDKDYLVLMPSVNTSKQDIDRVVTVLKTINRRESINIKPPVIYMGETVIPPKTALSMPSKKANLKQALGKILADPCVTCPPAVPILICGEKITAEKIECFKYYGIDCLDIVNEEFLQKTPKNT